MSEQFVVRDIAISPITLHDTGEEVNVYHQDTQGDGNPSLQTVTTNHVMVEMTPMMQQPVRNRQETPLPATKMSRLEPKVMGDIGGEDGDDEDTLQPKSIHHDINDELDDSGSGSSISTLYRTLQTEQVQPNSSMAPQPEEQPYQEMLLYGTIFKRELRRWTISNPSRRTLLHEDYSN